MTAAQYAEVFTPVVIALLGALTAYLKSRTTQNQVQAHSHVIMQMQAHMQEHDPK